jgi:hypothetical protein
VHDLQTAGTGLGTPEAEIAYNDALARVKALGSPLSAALTPLTSQVASLRAEVPTTPQPSA